MKRGFTLIETLLALLLGILIVFTGYSLYSAHQKSYQANLLSLELAQNGRIALDRMSREIRQAPVIVTLLPPDQTQPPASEIMFQDGHDTSKIRYITYYLEGTDLKRRVSHFYFNEEPDQWVYWDAKDTNGNSPLASIDEEQTIAENIATISFYGERLIHISLIAQKENKKIPFKTIIFSRNL